MTDNQLTIKKFLTHNFYLPNYITRAIKYYFLILLVTSVFLGGYMFFIDSEVIISIVLYLTFMTILMPIIIYIASTLKRVVNNIRTKVKTKVTYWAISKYILHLAVIILLYLWLSIVLLSSLLIIIN